MTKESLINVRGNEVIRLLAVHEALSFGAIRRLIEPPMTEKRLHCAIRALVEKRIVARRPFALYGGTAMFYEIAEPFRGDLNIGKVHATMLMHNDIGGLTIEALRREFPSAQFVTERYIPKNAHLRNVMRYHGGARDALPDILMVLPGRDGRRDTYIALEIERFSKCTKRLLHKLGRYGARTVIDGVAYLAPDNNILKAVTDRYQIMIANKATRIRHYKDHFLVTCQHPTKKTLEFKDPRNAAGEPVSLIDWIHKLSSTQMSERSDRAWLGPGGVPPRLRPVA